MARVRRPASDPNTLPPDIAAGPTDINDRDAHREWLAAGSEWSQGALGNLNGWRALLPPEVRAATSARARHQRMTAG